MYGGVATPLALLHQNSGGDRCRSKVFRREDPSIIAANNYISGGGGGLGRAAMRLPPLQEVIQVSGSRSGSGSGSTSGIGAGGGLAGPGGVGGESEPLLPDPKSSNHNYQVSSIL